MYFANNISPLLKFMCFTEIAILHLLRARRRTMILFRKDVTVYQGTQLMCDLDLFWVL